MFPTLRFCGLAVALSAIPAVTNMAADPPPRAEGGRPAGPPAGGKSGGGPGVKGTDPVPTTPEHNIQWFATLESAKAEAARTGRPILLTAGTPHCSGISGIW